MRCPKCGFISFDHLDACRKCGKNIAQAAAELNGTVYAAIAPNFLIPDQEAEDGYDETYNEPFPESGRLDSTESLDTQDLDDSLEFSLDKEEAEDMPDFSMGLNLNELEEEPAAIAAPLEPAKEDEGLLKMELDDFGLDTDELVEEKTPELELDDDLFTLEEPAPKPPRLDFDESELADFTTPKEEEIDKEAFTETFILDDAFTDSEEVALPAEPPPVARPRAASPPARPAAKGSSVDLEDLHLEGIELEEAVPAAAPAAKAAKPQKGVKTGTALDDFDEIDLGDLLSKK